MTIYHTGFTQDGTPKFGGIYRMKDEYGFPIDLSLIELRSRGAAPDWLEYLADAGSQDGWKYDSAVAEMRSIIGDEADAVTRDFAIYGALLQRSDDDFQSVCRRMIEQKRVSLAAE